MIKRLFFTAVLLMPSLAYAGNPSANLSVQVVPAASTPPLPAGAQAAGYTTLAFHSDFTSPSYSNVANWLDCAGASNPTWFVDAANGTPAGPVPCGRISMTTDGGVQVMDMKFTAADAAQVATALVTINTLGGFNKGLDFPNGGYFQATYRLANGQNTNAYGLLSTGWWSWSDTGHTGLSPAYLEKDFLETYSTGCCHNDSVTHQWGSVDNGAIDLAGFGLPEYPIDITTYHTIAMRWTQDGSATAAMCMYIDGVFQNCGSKAMISSQLNQRNYPILTAGPQSTTPATADYDILVKDVQIWTCAGWRGPLNTPGNACNGAVLTSAP